MTICGLSTAQVMSGLRARYVSTWTRKFIEVMAVTFLVVTVGFMASYFSEPWACRPALPLNPALYDDGAYITPYISNMVRLTCPKGYYNEVRA